MLLTEAKQVVEAVEALLAEQPFVEVAVFERDGRTLHLALTERLQRLARRDRVWKGKQFLTALKNAQYGFDPKLARRTSGYDGIFLLDRDFKPPNEMMRKLFDQYLDKPSEGAGEVAKALKTKVDAFLPVRLVSHHMRLLGVLHRGDGDDWLVLVDYDATK